MAAVINIVAWILCIVIGILLFGDFIRTEMQFSKEAKEAAARKEVIGDEPAE